MISLRVLYGENLEQTRPKLLRDLERGFTRYPDYANSHTYFVLGREAHDTLRAFGATNVHIKNDSPYLQTEGGNPLHTWNKLWLIREAVLEYRSPVMYTDLDVYPTKHYDPNTLRKLLQERRGLARMFQMPLIQYKRPYFWYRPGYGQGPERVSPKLGLFGCFIYLASLALADWFFAGFDEMRRRWPKARIGDELFITYAITRSFGEMTLQELSDTFAPDQRIIKSRHCGLVTDDTIPPMLRHKR